MSRLHGLSGRLRWAADRSAQAWREEGARGLYQRSREYLHQRKMRGKEFEPVGPDAGGFRGAVLMLGQADLAQCWHFRVEQKQEACATAGIPFIAMDPARGDEVISYLQLASLLIVYRLPASPMLVRTVAEARRLGIPVVYETDDIMYSRGLVSANPNLQTLPKDLRQSVINGADLMTEAMALCDGSIASTEPLAADMATVISGPTAVVDNGIDNVMMSIGRGIRADREAGRIRSAATDGQVIIGYGSGSRAHDIDLAVAAPALASVMAQHDHVRLRLLGPLAVPPELAGFAHRIDRIEMLPYGEFLWNLAHCDINIAPLADAPFNYYKSQVKYLEAGLLEQPFVASQVLYGNYVTDGVTGLLADDVAGWARALEEVVLDADSRRELAEAAALDVQRWNVHTCGAQQMRDLVEIFGVRAA